MRTIHKFDVSTICAEHELPDQHDVLCVQRQDSQYGEGWKVWVMLEDSHPKAVHRFQWVMTGDELPPEMSRRMYIGTCELKFGIIGHLFYWLKK